MHVHTRIAATALVATVLSVAVAAPSVALPIDRGHGVTIVWTKRPGGWEGRSNGGASAPLFIYSNPSDYSSYGQTNGDGTITTYGKD